MKTTNHSFLIPPTKFFLQVFLDFFSCSIIILYIICPFQLIFLLHFTLFRRYEMYNLNDTNDIINFKARLSKARKSKYPSQEKFAEALGYTDRSRVANWESQKSGTLFHLCDFTKICNLLDVDPNYLLGVSDDKSTNDKEISNAINISAENVTMLRNHPYTGHFLNFILSSDKLKQLLKNIEEIYLYHINPSSMPLDKIFSPLAYQRLKKAFYKYQKETFPLNMNETSFSKHVENAFPPNPKEKSFFDFVKDIVIDKRYYDMILSHPDFDSQTDSERYENVIYDISHVSYKYLITEQKIEISEQQVSQIFAQIIKDFIDSEIKSFKNRSDESI